MYIANSTATTKLSENRSIPDMLRKERKQNHIKHITKTKNGRKRMEEKWEQRTHIKYKTVTMW